MISLKQSLRASGLGAVLLGLLFVGTAGAQNSAEALACKHKRKSVVLLAGGIDNQVINGTHVLLATAELYHPRSGSFTATGSMNFGRTGHTATRLRDGKVLITGGDSNATDEPFNSAELYDPATGTFTVTGSMTKARVGHTATLLRDGKVLVVGGQGSGFIADNSAELYDPASGTFEPTGSTSVRVGHSATLLPDDTVLIAGGQGTGGACPPNCALASAEIYDPSTGTFSPTGSMLVQHEFHSAILLRNGQVLIAGGGSTVDDCSGCSTADGELYDPASKTFSETGSLITGRRGQTATELRNGEVLVTGGLNDQPPNEFAIFLKSAELYNPATGSFTATGDMTDVRFDHSASLLDDGRVLVAGGFDTGTHITDTAELYDLKKGTFVETGNMTDARAEQTATGVRSHRK